MDSLWLHQGSIHKAFIGPGVNEHSDGFGLASPQQGSTEGFTSSKGLETPSTAHQCARTY